MKWGDYTYTWTGASPITIYIIHVYILNGLLLHNVLLWREYELFAPNMYPRCVDRGSSWLAND
jgi:hypothetical protein